jgi:hypothetical protein
MPYRREPMLALTMKLEKKDIYRDTGDRYAKGRTEPECQVQCSVLTTTSQMSESRDSGPRRTLKRTIITSPKMTKRIDAWM